MTEPKDRLTFDGNFCDIAQCREERWGKYCPDGACSQRKVWERLKEYEDAADVAPVRHGRWVHSRYENCSEQFEIVKCSCCWHEAYAMAFYVHGGNYCPNCGARMTEDIAE